MCTPQSMAIFQNESLTDVSGATFLYLFNVGHHDVLSIFQSLPPIGIVLHFIFPDSLYS